MNIACRFIEWLYRKCSGVPTTRIEAPIKLREASHRLNNEVMILQSQAVKVRQESDALSDLVSHMNGQQ